MIVAFKRWEDTEHYIHKDSTEDKVIWTENIDEAKMAETFSDAWDFFFETLGFHSNPSLPDALHLIGI